VQRQPRSPDLAQGLVIGAFAQHSVGHVLDLVALTDQAACLSDHHTEHADGRCIDWQRQPNRRARRLVDIRQETLLTHLATDDVPGGFDEGLLRQSHDALRCWEGVKEGEEPVVAAIPKYKGR
jgi:hypothetical protein